jgi:hypothetical protein
LNNIMMEEEGMEAVFREGMNAVLKEQDENVINVNKPKKEQKEEEPPSIISSSSLNKGEGEQHPIRTFSPTTTRNREDHQSKFPGRFLSLIESGTINGDYDDDTAIATEFTDYYEEDSENNYHPALKAAADMYTEGQEAVWHEDEYSVVSSVFVQPEKKNKMAAVVDLESVAPPPHPQQKSRNRMSIPFFKSRGKKQHQQNLVKHQQLQIELQHQQSILEIEDEPTPRPVKIHVKRKMVSKAVLLLPTTTNQEVGSTTISMTDTEANETYDATIRANTSQVGSTTTMTADIDHNTSYEEETLLVEANETYDAITANTIQARRLLDTVLSGSIIDEEKSERATKAAFTHAATARRLAYRSQQETVEGDNKDVNDNGDYNGDDDDDDDNNEEMAELEQVMSYLAEEGEQAALKHRQHIFNVEEGEDDDQEESRLATIDGASSIKGKEKRQGKFAVSGYASRAVHYLESILPKTSGSSKRGGAITGADDGDNNESQLQFALSTAEDFWSDSGISSLGLKNDTLEYGFSNDDVDDNNDIYHDGAGLLRNLDMMSLSSLNEILDGTGTLDNGCYSIKHRQEEEDGLRRAVPEIGIPNKKKNVGPPPTQPRRNRGILGLMTPKSSKLNTNKKRQAVGTNNNKKWGGFFRTPRAGEGIPSKLLLVVEEPEEEEDASSSSSALGSAPGTVITSTSDGTKINHQPTSHSDVFTSTSDGTKINHQSISHSDSNTIPVAGAYLVETESDSHFGIEKINRYEPAVITEDVEECHGNGNRYRSIPKGNEIELKLSVTTSEGQDWGKHDNDSFSEKNKEEYSSSLGEKGNTNHSDRVERKDSSASNCSRDHIHLSINRYKTEPIGKTPKRDGLEIEERLSEQNEEEEKELEEERLIPKAPSESVERNAKKTTNKASVDNHRVESAASRNEIGDRKMKSHVKAKCNVQKDSREEMSTAVSEGSKSKIFGRIVDMMGQNKQRQFVPNTIVEETYILDKDNKNFSIKAHDTSELRKSTKKNLDPKKVIPGKISNTNIEESSYVKNIPNKARHANELRKPTSKNLDPKKAISEKKTRLPAVRKPTVGQRAKEISKMKKQSKSSTWTVIDDSTVVVRKAISNGNLKAVQSNEDDDDVPLNYLALMLKKKLKEEKRKGYKSAEATETKEHHQQQRSHEKPDADSFVAEIRGARSQEAPGVALGEITTRNHPNNLEPTIGNDENMIRTDLAPTPRRSDNVSVFVDIDEDETKENARDPPLKDEEDERQRRRMITERLFQAGSSEEESNPKKEISTDVIKTVPTVDAAESYDEEPVQDCLDHHTLETAENNEMDEKKNGDITSSNSRIESTRTPRRRLSISFLKGGKRNK